jgi:hypothetical protein
VLLVAGGCLLGCASIPNLSPNALPRDYQDVTKVLMDKLSEEGVLKDWMAEAEVRGIQPGLEAFFRTEYAAGVRLADIAVDAEARGSGEGQLAVPEAVMDLVVEKAAEGDPEAMAILREWVKARATYDATHKQPEPAPTPPADEPQPVVVE